MFVWVDILATEKDPLEKVDVVLFPVHNQHIIPLTGGGVEGLTSLSESLPVSPFTTANVPKRSSSPNESTLRDFQSSTRSARSTTAVARCSLSMALLAASNTHWMLSIARLMSAWRSGLSVCLRSSCKDVLARAVPSSIWYCRYTHSQHQGILCQPLEGLDKETIQRRGLGHHLL